MSGKRKAAEPKSSSDEPTEEEVQCDGCKRWFLGSRHFIHHLPHCSNSLLGAQPPGRESPPSPSTDVQHSGTSLTDTGLVTHTHDQDSMLGPTNTDSVAASRDNNPPSDVCVLPTTSEQRVSASPFRKDATLGSPECSSQTLMADTLQCHNTSLKCHNDLVKLINTGLQNGLLAPENPHSKLAKTLSDLWRKSSKQPV